MAGAHRRGTGASSSSSSSPRAGVSLRAGAVRCGESYPWYMSAHPNSTPARKGPRVVRSKEASESDMGSAVQDKGGEPVPPERRSLRSSSAALTLHSS